jgi:hypothetical protein
MIREGVTRQRMKGEGRDRAVYNGVFQTALAAVNAGWTFPEWAGELSKRGSLLGVQLATKGNGEDRPRDQVEKQLRTIWDRATARAEASPSFTSDQRADYIAQVRVILSDPNCRLSENEVRVLDAIARRAADLNCTTPSCPRDGYLRPATGLGLTALRTALDGLIARGLLVLVEKGQRGTPDKPSSGKANVYRLPRPEVLALAVLPSLPTSAAVAASSAPSRCPALTSSAPPAPAKWQVKPLAPPRAPHLQEDPVTPQQTADIVAAAVKAAMQPQLDAMQAEIDRLRALVPDAELAPVRHLTAVPRPYEDAQC